MASQSTFSLTRPLSSPHLEREEAGLVPVDPHHVTPPLVPKQVPLGGGQGHVQQVRLVVRPGEVQLTLLSGLAQDELPWGHWKRKGRELRELSGILSSCLDDWKAKQNKTNQNKTWAAFQNERNRKELKNVR